MDGRRIGRRGFGLTLGALALLAATAADAAGASPLEGTWGGAEGALSAQVIVSGGVVIGFFWREDYLEPSEMKASADGASLSFAFPGGTATLTRTGDRTAMLEVRERSGVTRLALKRD